MRGSPDEFATFIATNYKRWLEVAKAAHIQAD
jgi:hypothetical protein